MWQSPKVREIEPQGYFLALRARGATPACELVRDDTQFYNLHYT